MGTPAVNPLLASMDPTVRAGIVAAMRGASAGGAAPAPGGGAAPIPSTGAPPPTGAPALASSGTPVANPKPLAAPTAAPTPLSMVVHHTTEPPPEQGNPMPDVAPSSLPPSANPRVLAPRGTVQGDEAERTNVLSHPAGLESVYGKIAHSDFGQNHPFAGKLLGTLAQIPSTALDVGLSGILPRVGQLIPGTTVQRGERLQGLNRQIGAETGEQEKQATTAETNARIPLTEAQTEHTQAETAGLPAQEEANLAHTKAETTSLESPKPVESSVGLLQVKPDGTAQRVTVDGQPVGPVLKTEVKQIEVNGKPHQVLVNSQTGDHLRDLGETGEKPPVISVNAGQKNLWSVPQPDGSHKVVSLKAGDTIPKGAVSLSGQSAENSKEGAADAPTVAALKFANDYLSSGAFTGPSDEALQDQFFQLAKPSTGFRMNQAQISQLHDMASWMDSWKGRAYHAINGTWFAPEQRQNIVKTMNDLAASKGMNTGTTPSGPQGGGVNDPLGIR